jgi:drug/metabolite transporter (DMT)-like permease
MDALDVRLPLEHRIHRREFGLPYAQPVTFLLLRFGFVLALMLPIALVLRARRGRDSLRLPTSPSRGAAAMAGISPACSPRYTRACRPRLAALIVGLQPVLTAVVAAPLLRERVTRRQWLGLALGFGGVAMVVAQRATFAGLTAFSATMILIALLSITAGTVYQKRFCGAFDLRAGSVIQFVAAGLALAPFALLFEH